MQKFQTKLKELWEKVKGLFLKLNKKIRILLGVCLVVVLAIIILAAIRLNQKEYALLYGGLTASETSTIVSYLSDNGVTDYQIQGDSIYVPKGREGQLQAQLAMSGYRTTGYTYEYWGKHSGGITTSSDADRAWLIAGEQKLDTMLRGINGVRDAEVKFTPGTDRIYVLDPKATPATATVKLELEGNQPLSNQTVEAIRGAVAFGMEGLEVSNVFIYDTMGNTYSDSTGIGELSEASALKLQYEQEINNKVRSEILRDLETVYGKGNVTVSVNSNVDMNRKVIERTEYEQPEGSTPNGGLIGSEKWFWERVWGDTEGTGGVVGSSTNSDLSNYPDVDTEIDPDERLAAGEGSNEQKINTETQQIEVLAGTVTNIGVGVQINQNAPNSGAQTIDALREHIAVISGIGSEDPVSRVSVLITPFAVNPPAQGGSNTLIPGVDNWVVLAALGGLLLFIVLLAVILLLRSRSKKKKLAQQQALEEEMMAAEAAEAAAIAAAAAAAAAPTGGADIMEVNTEKSMELRKTVRLFAQNNPEIAAQMVKAWLKGEENSAGT